MDKIKIKDLEVYANHGVFPEETKLGQKFLVSADLYTDVRKAGCTDELEESTDYGAVCHFITEYLQKHTWKLIESVAAVSYTHLDVYKRQVRAGSFGYAVWYFFGSRSHLRSNRRRDRGCLKTSGEQ